MSKIHLTAPFTAIAYLGALFAVDASYEFDTWQALLTYILVEFLFISCISFSKINYIKARWMSLLLRSAMIAGGAFCVIVYMRESGLIDKNSASFPYFELAYQYVNIVITALLFLTAFTRQKLLSKFDDLCWPSVFNNIYIRSDDDSWQTDKQDKECQHKH